jgi:RNA methyltransferase, TrmH family
MTRPLRGLDGPRRNGFRRSQLPIDNLNHPAIRRIPRLAHRSERDAGRTFFTEGVRFVSEALANNARVDSLVVCPRLLNSPHGRRALHAARARGLPVHEVTPHVWQRLSLIGDPQGIGATIRQQWTPLCEVDPCRTPLWIAVEQVNSPGNLGTLFRTCDAVGASGAICIGSLIDPYDPNVVRATMGALFSQRLVRVTHAEFARWKRTSGFNAIGASPHAGTDYRQAGFHRPTILFLGCEQRGMTPEQESLCDQIVRIPMRGRADSLNLGVAGSILLYEAYNQRHPVIRQTPAAAKV